MPPEYRCAKILETHENHKVWIDEVYLMLGGYHLFKKSASEVQTVINRFRELGVKKVAPCHCSGAETRDMFQEEYGADYIDIHEGRRYTVGGE